MIGTQYITTVCQNNISNRRLVASCGKINICITSITNWGKIITNRGSSSCNKLEQFQLLQIGAKLLQIGTVITNWDRIIANWGNYYKSV